MNPLSRLTHEQYTVGWVCVLLEERAAAVALLDERHQTLEQHPSDGNSYTLGRIGGLNIVIVVMGVTGTNSAATVARDLLRTFTFIRFGLMVGIGGGVPGGPKDIRLGDVVVSTPQNTYGGVIQYDFGKAIAGQFKHSGSLNKPPMVLLNTCTRLASEHYLEDSKVPQYLTEIKTKYPKVGPKLTYPGANHDLLFKADYKHEGEPSDCAACDKRNLIQRLDYRHDLTIPHIHHGLVASGNQVMRDGALREKYREELGILCFEMEAAGLMDSFPCLVIRGISDYSDTHKNDRWKGYAAATAAAYAKELLVTMPTCDVDRTPTAGNMVAEAVRNAGKSILHFSCFYSLTTRVVRFQMVLSSNDL